MNVYKNSFAISGLGIFFIFSILFSLTAFSPTLSVYFLILFLVFCNFPENNSAHGLLVLLVFTWVIFNALDVVSFENFILASDDFSSYYNNYVNFQMNGFYSEAFFEFGYGEIALPLINYLSSLIIDGYEPYKLKLIYSVLQSFGLIGCCISIAKYYNLSLKQRYLLIAVVIAFFKPLVGIQLSRQCFSSIFIVLSIFSYNRSKKISFFLISFLFHSSAIILYPLTVFLFKKRTKRDFLLTVISALGLYLFFTIAYSILRDSIINIPILNKLDYALRMISEPDKLRQSVITSLLLMIYLTPLILICFYSKKQSYFKFNILIIFTFLIFFSTFPGVNNRIFLTQLYLFLGVYYYLIMFHGFNTYNLYHRLFVALCFTFLFVQSHYGNEGRRFSNFDINPFFYMQTLDHKEFEINRGALE